MKSSDAKNPRFDDAWWRTNKAKDADKDKAFEKALKDYAALRATIARSAQQNMGVTNAQVGQVGKALLQVKLDAAKTAKDPKLGTFQKETKEALAVYEKKADAAVKAVQQFANSPVMKMTTADLMKHAPQFGTFSKVSLTEENYRFLVACKEKKFGRAMYRAFVREGGQYQINIDDALRGQFDAVEARVSANPPQAPDNAQTWAAAPWAEAHREIVRLSDADTVPKFRVWMNGQELTKLLP